MQTTELPDGFRIVRYTVGGTGNGDELFTIALQQWRIWTERKGLLRRKIQVKGWVVVEVGDPFRQHEDNLRALTMTARLLHGTERTPA